MASSSKSSCQTPQGGDDERACEVHSASDVIISALPSQIGWVTSELKQYQGFWLHDIVVPVLLTLQQQFRAREDQIILTSYPKSGTTWLKALLFSFMNRTRHNFQVIDDGNPLVSRNPHVCVPILEFSNDPRHLDNSDPDLLLMSTHLPYSLLPKSMIESRCKIVHVVREPKDVFVSLWHFVGKVRKGWDLPPLAFEDAFDMFCSGFSQNGPYWDYELDYWNASIKYPDRVCIITYEDLTNRPIHNVKKLAEFIGKPFTSAEEDLGLVEAIVSFCSFDKLSNLEANRTGTSRMVQGRPIQNKSFFRKAQVRDWKNYLSDEKRERFDGITYQKFKGTGLLDLVST